jgi:hypothetical protein
MGSVAKRLVHAGAAPAQGKCQVTVFHFAAQIVRIPVRVHHFNTSGWRFDPVRTIFAHGDLDLSHGFSTI